jgi:hypothetical protein
MDVGRSICFDKMLEDGMVRYNICEDQLLQDITLESINANITQIIKLKFHLPPLSLKV